MGSVAKMGELPLDGRETADLLYWQGQSPQLTNGQPLSENESTSAKTGKRTMPESMNQYLIKVQGGKLYLPAAYRIAWFREECPHCGIDTALIEGGQAAGFATFRCCITDPVGRVVATGHKTETRQDFPAGWVEKAETGSIGRALSFAGFGTQFVADDDEPNSHQQAGHKRQQTAMARVSAELWEGPGQCPKCHAPEGKRHGKGCVG